MVAASGSGNGKPHGSNGTAGGLGGGLLESKGIRDTRLIEKALRSGWGIPDEHKPEIVKRQIEIATSAECSPRERTSAARCLASMAGQDQTILMKLLDKIQPDKHSHEIASRPPVTLEQLHADEHYVDYLRSQATGGDSHAGHLCGGDQPRNGKRMEDGESP